MNRQEWWKKPFEMGWYPLESLATDWKDRTMQEVEFLKKIFPKGSRILDVGCGVGRHSVELAKFGYQVTGVDISEKYLGNARAFARRENVSAQFVRCDMRRIPFRNEFDGAINLFTSFGYFNRNSDNLRVLNRFTRDYPAAD